MATLINMKDALVTSGRLLREAIHLTADRLGLSTATDGTSHIADAAASGAAEIRARAVRGSLPIPRGAGDITPEWLTSVLEASFPGSRVESLAALAADAGTTHRARFAVRYANGPKTSTPTADQPPASVFVKLAPLDTKTTLFVNLMRLGTTEVRFYRELAAQLPVEVPRVFHAGSGGSAQRFVLVLEDLTIRNARFMDVSQRLTVDQARSVVIALARLHAAYWQSARFRNELAWLKSRDDPHNDPVERLICAAAVKPALRKFADLVPGELHAAAPRIIARRDALERAWSQPPLTLIHGDAHVGNMYLIDASPKTAAGDQDTGRGVGFLDWQVVQRGQGMRDVGYFLINSVPTELRRAHERKLIGSYLSTLREAGVQPPDFEQAWRQYRLHAIYAWIAAVVTAAAATFQAEAIVRAGLARSSTAILDLDSIAALDALES